MLSCRNSYYKRNTASDYCNYTMLFMTSFLIFYVAVTLYKHWDICMNRMTVSDI